MSTTVRGCAHGASATLLLHMTIGEAVHRDPGRGPNQEAVVVVDQDFD